MKKEEWTETRPWGAFKNLLDADFTKVKLIQVLPGSRLSYQSHAKRRESWTVVQGRAKVTINSELVELGVGEHIDIPVGAKHRIENPADNELYFVEVQTGKYFGEDDIVRYEDDYGRES